MGELLHLYGPISIHSYGLFIALGTFLFSWLIAKDNGFLRLGLEEKFSSILIIGIAAAFFGGRLFFILEEPSTFLHIWQWFAFWEPGFSILGSILGVLFIIPYYLKKIKIPVIPFFDLLAIYAPLLQSVSRIGCFFAGCCYGVTTHFPWGVIYKNSNTVAPLYTCIHPTQLYSSIVLLFIFVVMYFFLRKKLKKTGQLVSVYLILVSLERFFVDFLRADRTFIFNGISFTQVVACSIFSVAIIALIYSNFLYKNK